MHEHSPVFELLGDNEPFCGCGPLEPFVPCGGPHRIYMPAVPFAVGNFIYWNSTSSSYLLAVEGNCDLMVIAVDPYKTWFSAINVGEFNVKNFTLQGPLYINSTGALTNTPTSTKVGFIENGHLYLLIK
jgi:hypothetical protein